MRTYTRKFILTVSTLAILLLCPTVQASSITLTGNPTFGYQGILVGPYEARLGPEPDIKTWVFCLDLHIDTNVNTTYAGSLSHPTTEAEKEAAFLAAYSLYLGAPSGSVVNSVEGPISMAIWEIMGTLEQKGNRTVPDPAAARYIQLARSASTSGLISEDFLRKVQIWTPDKDVTSQRFMTAVRDDDMVENAVPEPGTMLFLGSGILLMVFSRIRRRR